MAAELVNDYGKIVLSDELITSIVGYAAVENYGIVGMKSKKTGDSIVELFKRDSLRRGVKVTMVDPTTIAVDLFVTLEYGVSLPAVAMNTRDNVKYYVEEYTGLKVQYVNIHVEGIRV